jgi:RHS repeat-associated protein
MQSLTDPVGNKTIWVYNLLGRVSREIITLDKKVVARFFYYDANGNIVTKIDRNNRVTSWTYDKLNRATSEIWHSNWRSFIDNKQPIKKFTTTYNNKGKIESTEDGYNKFTFSYGIFGNEIKQNQNLSDLGKPIEFNFVTNINGQKTEKILNVDGKVDHKNQYEFDNLNRTTKISQTIESNVKAVNIQYDNLGQLVKQTRFDSDKPIIVTKNKFDQSGRLTNISHTGNGKTYADYDLTWDNANRITDFDFTYLNGPAKKNESKYRYDKTSQLIAANYNFMSNEKYNFDLNGNRKTAEIQGKNESYKTGEYNRLLSDENYRYEYDQECNIISKTDKNNKPTKYFWDHRNRLTKVQTPTDLIEYIYDYQNRLVKRSQDNKTETHFVHDGWQIILQFDNKEIKPPHRYLWGTKQDELICDNNNWTLADHLNTIRDIVKSDGATVTHLEYNAFGKVISETKNDNVSFAYTGKLFDKSSNLQWNINRWYDSNVGKWVSEDPIGFKASDMNLNRYVQNMVLFYADPSGEVLPAAIGVLNSSPVLIVGASSTVVTFADLFMRYSNPPASTTIKDGKSVEISFTTSAWPEQIKKGKVYTTKKGTKFCAKQVTIRVLYEIWEDDPLFDNKVTWGFTESDFNVTSLTEDRKFEIKFGMGLGISCKMQGSDQIFSVSLPSLIDGMRIGATVDDIGGIELYVNLYVSYTVSGNVSTNFQTIELGRQEYHPLGIYQCEK